MNWPIYPHRGVSAELDRHAAGGAAGYGTGRYAIALDVWRGEGHIWRSYDPAHGESVFDWAERELPPGTAMNHDDGRWGVTGVMSIHRWPVPTLAALTPVASMTSLRDIMATCFAIGQLPDVPPSSLDAIPPEGSLYTRIYRAKGQPVTVCACDPVSSVAVRALITRRGEGEAAPDAPPQSFSAHLVPREARDTVPEVQLQTRTVLIVAPPRPNLIIRKAKAALGIPAWPAQRQGKTLTWRLTGAPYQVVVEPS